MSTELTYDTQISSKYSRGNPGIFVYQERLRKVGCSPSYPRGEQIIIFTPQEFAITTEQEAQTPFDKTQIDFFRKIRDCQFHTVYNVNGEDKGYLGESASIETAYAIVLGKRILLEDVNGLHFGQKVKPEIAAVITRNKKYMDSTAPIKWGIEAYGDEKTWEYMDELKRGKYGYPEYDVRDQDKEVVMKNVLDLTRKYRQAWNEFKSAKKPISSTPHQ
jgi:hypothetical protein